MFKKTRSTKDARAVKTQGVKGGSFGGRGKTVTGSALSGGKKKR